MRLALSLLLASAAFGQISQTAGLLTTPRLSRLNNRYHGRDFGRTVRTSIPVAPYIWLKPESLGSNGSSITSWSDSSGSARNATCGAASKPTVKTNAYGNYPAAVFRSTTGSQPAAGTPCTFSSISLGSQAVTIFVVYRRKGMDLDVDFNAAYDLWSMTTGSNDFMMLVSSDDHAAFTPDQASRTWAGGIKNAGTLPAPTAGAYTWDGPTVLALRGNATNMAMWNDNHTWVTQAAAATSQTHTAATLGCANATAGGGYCLSGEIFEVAVFNSALSDGNVGLMLDYFNQRYALHKPKSVQVFFDTNSQFIGYLGLTDNISSYVQDDFYHRLNFRTDSMYSYSTQQLNSAFALVIQPYYDKTQTNVIVMYEGLNDLIQGRTAAQALTNLQTYYTTAHNLGFKVIMCTPNAIVTQGSYTEAKRQTLLASMKTNTASISDVNVNVCDIGSDAIIGDSADIGNGTYFSDQTHFTEVGARLAANYVTAALRSLLAQ